MDAFHSILRHFAIIHSFLYSVNTPGLRWGRDTIDPSLDTTVQRKIQWKSLLFIHSTIMYIELVTDEG